jgi:hypothetical protein
MIQFTFTEGEANKFWRIGDPPPTPPVNRVVKVEADGEELMMIENRFINLPRVKGSQTTCWFGDDAKFIYGNLP